MHRGRVLLFTQSLGLVTALALGAVFASGRGGYWPLVGLEMLFGALWALDFPARRTALYALVGSSRVATAVSLETVSMQVAKMVGPVLAGVGLARLGPAPCYVAMAALYAIGLAGRPWACARASAARAAATPASVAASLGAGFRDGVARAHRARGADDHRADERAVLPLPAHAAGVRARRAAGRARSGWAGWSRPTGSARCWARCHRVPPRLPPAPRLFAAAVLTAPFLLLVFTGSRWRGPACRCSC